MNQVAKAGQGEQLPATQSATLLSQIIAASANPEVDANKMEQMANLALRLQDRERETQYAQDFAAAVMEMPRISKRNEIIIPGKDGRAARVQGKFASWENIDKVIRPILARHNLVLTFRIGQAEAGAVAVTPVLTHTSGYREVGDAMRVPADTSGSKNNAQAVGSSSQYGKRYAACAILNIVTEGEDRDGTSYPLATDELNDRQQRKVEEAYQAHKDGNYQTFWNKQTAPDRELLIVRGVHAELTGAPQLPGPRTVPEEIAGAATPTPEPEPEPEPQADQGEPATKRSASQLVEDYEKRVDACKSTDELMDLQRDPKVTRWLAQLKDRDAELFDRATTASSKRYATLLSEEDKAKQAGQGNLV
jgi:hypothetical protein